MSLRERQYYAHPQNLFWRIVGGILGFDPEDPLRGSCRFGPVGRIAVWDVLKSCIRPSSLDSAIDASSAVPNDFSTFLLAHPQIQRICFNGATAEALFMKHVRPRLAYRQPDIQYVRLPSTSPANASVPFAEKVRAWRAIVSQFRAARPRVASPSANG